MSQHPNAKPTPRGRETLVSRIEPGLGVAEVARQVGVSRQTAGKWLRRSRSGEGLSDRSSHPRRPARLTPVARVRYERESPDKIVHVDVKMVARIPDGGGWRALGSGGGPPMAGIPVPAPRACTSPPTASAGSPTPSCRPAKRMAPARRSWAGACASSKAWACGPGV